MGVLFGVSCLREAALPRPLAAYRSRRTASHDATRNAAPGKRPKRAGAGGLIPC